eukprot:scaffold78541_cov62-Phaeocystis_antarctica.AAC.7
MLTSYAGPNAPASTARSYSMARLERRADARTATSLALRSSVEARAVLVTVSSVHAADLVSARSLGSSSLRGGSEGWPSKPRSAARDSRRAATRRVAETEMCMRFPR